MAVRTLVASIVVLTVATLISGCGGFPGLLLPNEVTDTPDAERFELLARFVHITDAQIVDEESPGRLVAAAAATRSAWRPYEAYSTQLLDGFVRTVNKMHLARHRIDFVIHTGDATDNVQENELDWFLTAMDGGRIDPRSGPDDRDPASVPDPRFDPHHPFEAQGLYQNGVHGDAPTIPWYGLIGNHDRFAVGVFPIFVDPLGRRISPLPLSPRLDVFLPAILDPVGTLAVGVVSPLDPGPPPTITLPTVVAANPRRRFLSNREWIEAHLESLTEPPGHGFDPAAPDRTWYSVSPVPGLRLVALNSATPLLEQPGMPYPDGAISFPQVQFLRRELSEACAAGELVIVATHHPSGALEPVYGTALGPGSFPALLNQFACVALHLAGHWHRHVVLDRGVYVEVVTSSIIDAPQEGRVIELWREKAGGAVPSGLDEGSATPAGAAPARQVRLRYWTFSHLEEIAVPDGGPADLFADPLLPMRRVAWELAESDPR